MTGAALRLTGGIQRACGMRGQEPAVIDGDRRFTWFTFAGRVARLAAAWRALGVTPGDRIAILANSGHRYIEVYFAALWAGGILAPVNSRFALPEMLAMLADCSPRLLVADTAHLDQARVLQREAGVACLVHASDESAPAGTVGYEALIEGAEAAEDAGRGGNDLACLFYTGGTTGRAKGVMLSHANLCCNALNTSSSLQLSEQTVHLHCGPLFHLAAGARVYSMTMFGGTHVVLPRFEPDAVLRVIERERVTMATFVPAMIDTLLNLPGLGRYDLSSLRIITYGAAPMPSALLERLIEKLPGCDLLQSYGQTEMSPVATMLQARFHRPGSPLLRSVGHPLPNVELRIADPEDRPVPIGTIGEIQVRGPTVMLGYWQQPDETGRALRGGWLHSGDAGYIGQDGFLFLVDRIKDMIISGGENVYSAEVENVIYDHPLVAECAVFGIPHEHWGEAVHAVVVPKDGAELTAEAIISHCRGFIAGYKCPKSVDIQTSPLPRSGASKILKHQLRAPWWPTRTQGGP